MAEKWNGFDTEKFDFNGREAIVVFAAEENRTAKWLMKTEYFGAFPNAEIELVRRGFNLAYAANETRWCNDSDVDAKADFVRFLAEKYGFEERCAVVGMSCGGMIGVKFAAKYPGMVSALYLDAPVMNLLSCPAGLGRGRNSMWEEFKRARGMDMAQLISYRYNPIDVMDSLAEHKKPVLLVCGDSDSVVPYEENGALLRECYEKHGVPITVIVKEGCDHHPHGFDDPAPIVEFIERNA